MANPLSALTPLDSALRLRLPCHPKLQGLINDILNVKCHVLSPFVSLSSFTLSSLSIFYVCLLVSLISFVVFDVIPNLDHLHLSCFSLLIPVGHLSVPLKAAKHCFAVCAPMKQDCH